MPAASRKGNKSGPLVLPEGQGSGRGHIGYIITLAEDASQAKQGAVLSFYLVRSTESIIIRMAFPLSSVAWKRCKL